MKHKKCYCLCGIIITASVILGICHQLILEPLRARTFQISPWEILFIDFARPAFWICTGIIGTLVVFQKQTVHRFHTVFLWCGIALAAGCYGLILCSITSLSVLAAPSMLLPWLLKRPVVFLIPGILLGLGLSEGA